MCKTISWKSSCSKRNRLINFTSRKASGIENETDLKVDINELEKCITQGIIEQFNVEFIEEEISDYEMNLANKLYRKYMSDEHNKKR